MLLDQWLDIFFYNWKVKCLIPANMSFCCSLLKYVLKCKSGMYSKKKNRKHFHLTRFISVSHDGDKSFLSSGLYTIHCFGHSSCSGFLSAQTVSKGLIRIGTPTICLIEGAPKYIFWNNDLLFKQLGIKKTHETGLYLDDIYSKQ